jgi:hypothetical protein
MNNIILALLAALLCSGCGLPNHITRLQSSWYMQLEQGQPVTYIAVLNQGNTGVHIERLIINPIRDKIYLFDDPQYGGWELEVNAQLEPGALLLREAKPFLRVTLTSDENWTDCYLPIEIDAKIKDRRSLFITDMKPAMPTAIPLGWEQRCGKGMAR